MIGPFVSSVGANMVANGFFQAYQAPKTSPMPSATAPVKSSPLPPKKAPSWRGQTDLATLGGFQEPLKADNPSATFINVSFTKSLGSFASSNTLAPVGPDGSKTPLQPAKNSEIGKCDSCKEEKKFPIASLQPLWWIGAGALIGHLTGKGAGIGALAGFLGAEIFLKKGNK